MAIDENIQVSIEKEEDKGQTAELKRVNSSGLSELKWRVLIVDDDDEIHLMTKTILKRFSYSHYEAGR